MNVTRDGQEWDGVCGNGWGRRFVGMVGDGDEYQRGRLGMETNFAVIDGDGDKYPSPCSSLFYTTDKSDKYRFN